MRESAFAVNSLLLYLQMAATQISVALRDWRQKNVDRANFSFLMSGLSACTLGHDLCNYLQHGIDIETAEGLLERYVSGPGTPEDLRKLKKVLRVAKEQLKLALGVAKSFRDLSRDREEAVEDVPLMGVLEGPYGARRAAHPEIVANKVTVHATRREMEVKDFLIRGRKNALVRVFQNLLNNSAQQIGQAGILPGAIRIDLGRQGQAKPEGSGTPLLCVDILDTGPGIHWANRKRIFEAKFTTRKNGSGMGLYLVEEELRRIGGSVEVAESIIGLGTKMRLWLPLVDRDNESPMQGT
jgi:signal transduction histidine kinase